MKENRGPTFVSEPQIQYLVQLLEDIHRGYLQVPRFHRPFVWDLGQRLELMRSILDGLPIGTITLWRTHHVRIATQDWLGPHPPNVVLGDNQLVRQYLLDGVQRLTTLYGALYPPDSPLAFAEAGAESFSIYYNLESEDFVTPRQEHIGPYHLPLSVLLNSVELLRFHRSLRSKNQETWFERADAIARAFREYKVPIIPIVTDDLEMATRAFYRLNIQGTVMSEIHMVNALTWTSRFDLVAQVGELKEQTLNSQGWGDLNDDLLLKTCRLALGLDIQEESVEELSERIKARPQVLQESVSNIGRAAHFLTKHCRIERPSVLPYSLQLVLLAEAFRQDPSPDESTLLLLRDWFWMTTYGELFAGISGGRLQRVLDELVMNLERKVLTWPGATSFRRRPLGSPFHMRGARGRALALRLVDARPLDSSGEEIPASLILAREGTKALIHLVSRSELSEDQTDLYSSPANRLLVRPEDAPAIRKLLLEGAVSKEFLQSHIISPAAHEALRQGGPEKFLHLRMKELDALEEQFIAPIVQQLSLNG